jgi:hypothetical protein
MSSPNAFSIRAMAAVLAVTAAAWSSAALAQAMVVRSTGPSAAKYPVGKKFTVNERITLVAGDQLVLMDKGKTRTIAKPGTHNVSASVAATQTLTSTVTRMISRDGTMRSRGGLTRSAGTSAVPADTRAPNLWLIDARVGGNFCVADPARLMFWRPDMTGDAALKLEADGAGAVQQTLAFVDGQAYRRWPADVMPLKLGQPYRISGVGASKPVTMTFHQIEIAADSPESIADALLAKGCSAQLERLVDTMAEEEPTGR